LFAALENHFEAGWKLAFGRLICRRGKEHSSKLARFVLPLGRFWFGLRRQFRFAGISTGLWRYLGSAR
jgi:hypothetical protein